MRAMSDRKIAKIVVGLGLEGCFHYEIPLNMRQDIKVGQRAWVPFRNRRVIGYIVGFLPKSDIKYLRKISQLIDKRPILNPDILKLTKWISRYYFSSWGQAIEAAIPETLRKGKTEAGKRKRSSTLFFPETLELPFVDKQGQALGAVFRSIDKDQFRVFVLPGITTAGRIEVYLSAIARVFSRDKSIMMLVPEISLIPQLSECLRFRFGQTVAVFHSRLSAGERLRQWLNIENGTSRIVVGTRSAVLLPVKRLGMIIIDQEHDFSYKQDETPRYHSREVAIARAKLTGAVVILGSATPSLESYYNAKKKVFKLIKLNSDERDKMLPSVRIIDMRREIKGKGETKKIFSFVLTEAIQQRMTRKEGVVLFLNRRGFSTFVHCKGCGYVLRCKECRIPLSYHFQAKELVCRYCGYRQGPDEICPQCKKSYLSYFGLGTQKLESETARIFPRARIDRMDADSVKNIASYQKALEGIKKGKIDILVGTQMVGRIITIPRVTLVGIVSADMSLNLPDFRAGEHTFQILSRMAGKTSGRQTNSEVIIQTYNPEHYSIASVARYDYEKFYAEELLSRKELKFPPYVHIFNLMFRGKSEEKVGWAAERLAGILKKITARGVEIIGPASLPLVKRRGSFRRHILLKGRELSSLNRFLRQGLKRFKTPSGVIFKIDVDPVGVP